MAANTDGLTFCRQCGEKQRGRQELRHHIALQHLPPTATRHPQSFAREDDTKKTIQASNTVSEPKMVPYCDICERKFVHDEALQMHVQNSKIHKKEARKRRASTQEKEAKATQQPVFNAVALTTSLYGQHLSIANTPLTMSGLQFQLQSDSVAAVYLSTQLQPPDTIATENSGLAAVQDVPKSDGG